MGIIRYTILVILISYVGSSSLLQAYHNKHTQLLEMRKFSITSNFLVIFLILSLCLQSESRILELSTVKLKANMGLIRGRSNRQTPFKPNPEPTANTRSQQVTPPPPIIGD